MRSSRTLGYKQPLEPQSHLGLVMAKLARINFNLERALECTWPRTLQNGGRVLLLPLLPQIGPVTYMCKLYICPVVVAWDVLVQQFIDNYFAMLGNFF